MPGGARHKEAHGGGVLQVPGGGPGGAKGGGAAILLEVRGGQAHGPGQGGD